MDREAPAVVEPTALPAAEEVEPEPSPPTVKTQDEGPGFTVVQRSQWGGEAPDETILKPHEGAFRHLTVHHTAGITRTGTDEASILRSIQRMHMHDKGWGDIAYHYLIGPSGKVYEGRDTQYQPDTATRYDTSGHLAICLLGNFEEQAPTPQALETLVALAAQEMEDNGLTAAQLTSHQKVAATLCPGKNLEAWFIGEGKNEIAKRLEEGLTDREIEAQDELR